MRSSTAGEQTVLAATFRKTYYRAKIADADGDLQDMGNYSSYGWMYSVEIDENIDQPIAAATIRLQRDLNLVGGLGLTSLSPLRSDSPANPDGPSVFPNRAVEVEMAVVTGSRPADGSSDWKPKFDGISDRISDISSTQMTTLCRDKGALLQDQVAPTSGNAVTGGPISIEQAMNKILLNASVGAEYSPIAAENVYLPAAINYAVRSFPYKGGTVMDACLECAGLTGADFRYAWDDSTSAYRPTLSQPDREPASTDLTLGSSQIVGWRQLEIDRLGVRNVVVVNYRRKSDGVRVNAIEEDEDSKVLYGRRVLLIQEADDSTIDTAAEAEQLANLILSDLKEPSANAEVEILPDWRIELGDYITFSANRFFDNDQDLAVIGIRHVLEPNSQRTFLTLRGTPSGGYKRWLKRAALFNDVAPTDTDNGLSAIVVNDDPNGTSRTWSWTRGANVAFVAYFNTTVNAPVTASAYPSPDSVPAGATAGTTGYSILSTATDAVTLTRPRYGQVAIGMAVPFYKVGGGFAVGAPVKFELMPGLNDDPKRAVVAWASTSTSPTVVDITVTVYDPSLFRQKESAFTVDFVLDDVVFPSDTCDADDHNETFTATLQVTRTANDQFVQPYVNVCTRSMYDSARGLGVVGTTDHLKYTQLVTVPHT